MLLFLQNRKKKQTIKKMEGCASLQEKLNAHKKNLKDVDLSIKRLNGSERLRNDNKREDSATNKNENSISKVRLNSTRKVNLVDNNRNLKRKSFEDQGLFGTNKRRSMHNEAESAGEEDDTLKPTIKSSVVSSNMPIKSKEELIKLQNKYTGSEQRNKRIFGHLLGTLSQFKNDDKVRSSTVQAIHRKELEKKIELQKIEEKKKVVEEKRKLEDEKHREQKNIEILETKIRIAKEFESWKANQLQYKKFIRTRTKPFIFYLPKTLDDSTEKLLLETALLIDEQIAKKLKVTEGELDVLTKQSASLNNEVQESNENKENKESHSSDEESEMDEEKNSINVRIGDEDEDEPAETSIDLNEKTPKAEDTKSPEINSEDAPNPVDSSSNKDNVKND